MREENKYIKQSIERLDIPVEKIDILKGKKKKTLGDLCNYSKTDLKSFNLSSNEINKIQIELQLLGLKLKNVL